MLNFTQPTSEGPNMNNILVQSKNISDHTVTINDANTLHHMIKVLRIKSGKIITISDGTGNQYLCQIDSVTPEKIQAIILEKKENNTELQNIKISIFQGITKGHKMETIIQKSVELGVTDIYPMYMERSIPLDKGKNEKKCERWQKIANETLKQCKGSILAKVHQPLIFKDCLEILQQEDLVIFPYEASDNFSIHKLIDDFKNNMSENTINSISIVIGPEGGFSSKEVEHLKSLGIRPITLGRRILRTETAAIATIAMVVYEFEL